MGGGDVTASQTLSVTSTTACTGAVTLSNDLTVDGDTIVKGTTQIGNAAADTITIYGNVVLDSTAGPNIDFSASSGTFLTTTGVSTFGGSGNTVSNAITFQGHVTGDADADPNFDWSASSGTFKTSTGATTVGGAVTFSTTVDVGGVASFNAATNFGNAKEDTVTIYGDITCSSSTNPDIDLSGSSGTFSTTTGASTLGGSTTAATNDVSFNGAVNLGNAKGDTVTFYGSVAADSTQGPDFDFSGSAGTFVTSGGTNTISGAMTVAGAASFGGDVNLGDSNSDSITLYGALTADSTANPNFDLSSSSGSFTTTSGSITIGGAVTLDSSLSVSGETTLEGDVNLGDAAADTVTFFASVVADAAQDPAIDFSGSTGAFLTTSGSVTVGGSSSTVTVPGPCVLQGTVGLGDAAEDTITIYGNIAADGTADPNIDFSGSGGEFKTPSGAATHAGAATFSSTVAVTGTASFAGSVNLGNAKADTITFYGDVAADGTADPDIDFSGSQGVFKSSTGDNTLGGNTDVTGALTQSSAVCSCR